MERSDLSDIHWVISEWLCRCICRKALISNQDSRANSTERILRYELEKKLRLVKTKTDKVAHWLKNLSSWLSFQPKYTMDKWENMHWTWTGHGNQLLATFDIFWQLLDTSFAVGRLRLIFSSFWQLLNKNSRLFCNQVNVSAIWFCAFYISVVPRDLQRMTNNSFNS